MDYNNSKNILELKERLTDFIEQYKKAIEDVKKMKGVKNIQNRKYLNDCIKEYKKNISSLEDQIKMCNKRLMENSTFPTDMLIEFIRECISIYEKTPYVDTRVTFTETINVGGNYNAHFNPKYIVFDASLEEQEKALEKTFLARGLSQFYISLLKESNYILGDYNSDENLITENGLKSNFKKFPYLEEIAYNLIDNRLANPDKDLQTVLNEEITEIKTIQKSKKKV